MYGHRHEYGDYQRERKGVVGDRRGKGQII